MRDLPRLPSVMGIARALLGTLGAEEAVDVMLLEFGWDVTFQSLALLRGDDADRAFVRCCEQLLLVELRDELAGVDSPGST